MKPGIHSDLSIESYHDRSIGVSRSTLMRLEGATPLDLWHYLEHGITESEAMLLGSAVDALVFEPDLFAKDWLVVPKIDRRTKAGKAAYEEVERMRAAGKIVIQEPMYEEAMRLADAVNGSVTVQNLMPNPEAQMSILWDEKGQMVKARPDGYDEATGYSFDLKTTTSLDDDDLARTIIKYGYDVQAAMVGRGLTVHEKPWRAHVLVWVRKSDPIDVRCTVMEPGGMWGSCGEGRYFRLLREYTRVMKEGSREGWDSPDKLHLPMPKWASIKYTDDIAAADAARYGEDQ